MYGLKARLNNQQVFLEIKQKKLFIKNTNIILHLSDILSLKTKQDGDLYYLMIISKSDKLILEFINFNIRDLCKSLILASINDTDTYKEIDYDTKKFITSLSAPLLTIFSDMNCTISQFYNYFMQSNFYDSRNKPTSLDRLITEKLREDTCDKVNINSLTRINNYSFLMVHEDTISKPLNYFPKEISFEPIYDLEEEVLEETETLDVEVEETGIELKIERKVLKKILEISKKKWRGEEIDEESKNFIELYKDVKYIKRLII